MFTARGSDFRPGSSLAPLDFQEPYLNLWNYTRRIYHLPGVAETVKFDHIKRHYFDTHEGTINRRIVPKGPTVDYKSAAIRSSVGIAHTVG